jgi:nitronate monooxygenase
LADWERKSGKQAAPFDVNFWNEFNFHKSNPRWQADLDICVKHKAPLIITSLGAVAGLVDAVHSYSGLVFHDVVNAHHGKKAATAGLDGLIAVCNGAGGHAGSTNPFALVAEIRQFFDKTVILAGSLSHGKDVATAEIMGADMAYMGTRFLATVEANIADDYQDMIINSSASDILYTPKISGVNASFMRQSVVDAGIDPTDLPPKSEVDFGDELELGNQKSNEKKAWRDIWSAGQGVGSIDKVLKTADLVTKLAAEHRKAITSHQKKYLDTFAKLID